MVKVTKSELPQGIVDALERTVPCTAPSTEGMAATVITAYGNTVTVIVSVTTVPVEDVAVT